MIVARLRDRAARRRDGLVDGLVGDRDRNRAARRRMAGRHGLVAVDLRRERAVRDRHARARVDRGAAARARDDARPRRLARRRADVFRPRRPGAGADTPAGRRVGQPAGLGARARRAGAAGPCSSTHERRTPAPMLPLGLFKRRNFAVGNIQTFTMYGGLSITFFLLVLYLQEVAGYSALDAGFALMPSTIVMFFLSKRMGRLADRYGPRLFMGLGPLGGGRWAGADDDARRPRELLHRSAAGAGGVLARARRHRGPAAGGGALRRRRVGRRDRFGRQQRGRARGRPDRDRCDRGGDQRSVESSLDHRLAGDQAHSFGAGRRDPSARGDARPRRSGARRREVAHAVQSASVGAFHLGVGISAALVALGGLLGLVGIRTRGGRCAARTAPAGRSGSAARCSARTGAGGRLTPPAPHGARGAASRVRV